MAVEGMADCFCRSEDYKCKPAHMGKLVQTELTETL